MNRAVESQSVKRGWHAHLQLGFCCGEEKTLLAHRKRTGPLTLQRPFYPEDDVCHVYLLHPPGGVVGGDEIRIDLEIAKGAASLITTPGATKFYRSAGNDALVNNQFHVEGDLEWLPQETIVFDQARLKQKTVVELGKSARFIGWEMICLGRPASKQWFETGAAIFLTQVSRLGVPLLMERLPIASAAALNGPACLRDNFFAATMLVTPANQQQREKVLQYIRENTQGELLTATLFDGLLAVRYLGQHPLRCRNHFIALWQLLRPEVLDRAPVFPRIWNT